MPRPANVSKLTTLAARFGAFIAERYPFALPAALTALEASQGRDDLHAAFRTEIGRLSRAPLPDDLADATPRVTVEERLDQARVDLLDACEGFFRREAIRASLTRDERREILRGMVLTRAVDNRLKQFFASGEVRWRDTPFQGKGFRSLGQEAIYAGGIRLHRGATYRRPDG